MENAPPVHLKESSKAPMFLRLENENQGELFRFDPSASALEGFLFLTSTYKTDDR